MQKFSRRSFWGEFFLSRADLYATNFLVLRFLKKDIQKDVGHVEAGGYRYMESSLETQSISAKILKLLALADGNKNEHERDSAMKLAMELLAKHNLELDAVKSTVEALEVIEVKYFLRLDPWIRKVLSAACKLYYTSYFMRPEYRGYYYDRKEWHPSFVGTAENIEVTVNVAAWLIESIRVESNYMFREQFERRSFRLGAADKLYKRACRLIEEEKNPVATSGANLIVLRNKMELANEKYKASKNLGVFQSRGSYCDDDAYRRGEQFGDSVNLGKNPKLKAITMR